MWMDDAFLPEGASDPQGEAGTGWISLQSHNGYNRSPTMAIITKIENNMCGPGCRETRPSFIAGENVTLAQTLWKMPQQFL